MKFEDMINKIINCDCYEMIKNIPDKSVDLIVTDPPYEIDTIGSTKNKISQNFSNCNTQLKNICDGINEEILDEFMRIMKKPNIYIWCNKKQILQYLKYFVEKKNCNFEILVWCKENPTPLCGGNYLIDKEFCLYFRKGVKLNTKFETAKTYFVTKKNKKDKDLFEHPTIKPLEIIRNLIINSSNKDDIVLDCFCGSGTTCVACQETGRRFIGMEINKEYYEIANKRINGITAWGQASIFTDFDKLEKQNV